ncbi:MAG: hypothetical protein QOF78_950 [Phycisphaerales bacterium]|jgi:anti-sigma factor RsiW|nr:hypothetical protein [Phycisphaerales bacterium]
MPAQLDNLDREAAMMLYLAGELEPAERDAYERRLAAEPQLAAELQQVRQAHASITAEIEHADSRTRLPASEGVVVRRVSRAIGSWLANRGAAPAAPVKKGWPLPWWSYPTAVAASLLVGFLVWSSRQEVGPIDATPEVTRELSMIEAEQSELADWLASSLDSTADATMDREVEQILSAGGAEDLNSVYLLPREENSQ